MKYLLVLAVVFVGVWMWRNNRINDQTTKRGGSSPSKGADATQQIMVSCAHCGLHLPQTEALAAPGADAAHPMWFCSAEHRQLGVKAG